MNYRIKTLIALALALGLVLSTGPLPVTHADTLIVDGNAPGCHKNVNSAIISFKDKNYV